MVQTRSMAKEAEIANTIQTRAVVKKGVTKASPLQDSKKKKSSNDQPTNPKPKTKPKPFAQPKPATTNPGKRKAETTTRGKGKKAKIDEQAAEGRGTQPEPNADHPRKGQGKAAGRKGKKRKVGDHPAEGFETQQQPETQSTHERLSSQSSRHPRVSQQPQPFQNPRQSRRTGSDKKDVAEQDGGHLEQQPYLDPPAASLRGSRSGAPTPESFMTRAHSEPGAVTEAAKVETEKVVQQAPPDQDSYSTRPAESAALSPADEIAAAANPVNSPMASPVTRDSSLSQKLPATNTASSSEPTFDLKEGAPTSANDAVSVGGVSASAPIGDDADTPRESIESDPGSPDDEDSTRLADTPAVTEAVTTVSREDAGDDQSAEAQTQGKSASPEPGLQIRVLPPDADPCAYFQERLGEWRAMRNERSEKLKLTGGRLAYDELFQAVAAVTEAVRSSHGEEMTVVSDAIVQYMHKSELNESSRKMRIAGHRQEWFLPWWEGSGPNSPQNHFVMVHVSVPDSKGFSMEPEIYIKVFDSSTDTLSLVRDQVNKKILKAIKNSHWFESDGTAGVKLSFSENVQIYWEPRVPQQKDSFNCGVYTIMNAWALILGARAIQPRDPEKFCAVGREVIELALLGLMDSATIHAFFACQGFVPKGTTVWPTRTFPRTIRFPNFTVLERYIEARFLAPNVRGPVSDIAVMTMILMRAQVPVPEKLDEIETQFQGWMSSPASLARFQGIETPSVEAPTSPEIWESMLSRLPDRPYDQEFLLALDTEQLRQLTLFHLPELSLIRESEDPEWKRRVERGLGGSNPDVASARPSTARPDPALQPRGKPRYTSPPGSPFVAQQHKRKNLGSKEEKKKKKKKKEEEKEEDKAQHGDTEQNEVKKAEAPRKLGGKSPRVMAAYFASRGGGPASIQPQDESNNIDPGKEA